MLACCGWLCAVLAVCGGAWGQAGQPATAPAGGTPSAAELGKQLQASLRELPRNLESKITPEQQAKAAEVCKFYRTARQRVEELEDQAKASLGSLGILSGFVAGDAEVMLSGAKLAWEVTDRSKPAAHAATMLAWAGVLSGDPAAATEALEQLAAHPPTERHAEWARSMQPLAKGCGKPVQVRFKLFGGGTVNTTNLHGKVLVLDFWATWCGPCIASLPLIKEFHEERKKDKNFLLVSLSLDRTEADARRGSAKHGMTWPQAMGGEAQQVFGVRGIPHVVVLSPEGRVLFRGHPVMMDRIKWVTDFALRRAARSAGSAKAAKPAGSATKPAAPAPAPPRAETVSQQKYRLAGVYLKAGLRDKATAILREIIRDYPKTPAAEQARKDLGR